MTLPSRADPTRRALLRLGLLLPASAALAACAGRAVDTIAQRTAAAQEMEPTPACDPDGPTTRTQTEGPYFTRNSPLRRSLLDADVGSMRLVLAGTVFSRECQPIPGALLDFWQADDAGNYDNSGYRFRGHQFADEVGRYELETVLPGLYPGRTRHIHVKVQAPNGPALTTQVYFPDEPRNRTDGIFNSSLVMAVRDADIGKAASFDFVVNIA
jgi:protocatechuate 3,4-dioxygenase beta subunit